MKYLLILAIVLVGLVAADDGWKPFTEESVKPIVEECKVGENSENHEKLLESLLCCFEKMGLFTADKGYNADRLTAQLVGVGMDSNTAKALVEKCNDSNEQKSSPADWAYRVHMCFHDNGVEGFTTVRKD